MATQNTVVCIVQRYSDETEKDFSEFWNELLSTLQQIHRCTCMLPHERPLHYLLAHGSETEVTSVMELVKNTEQLRTQVSERNSEQRNILHEAACSQTSQQIETVGKFLTEDDIVYMLSCVDNRHETPMEAAAFLDKVDNFGALLRMIPHHRKLEVVENLNRDGELPTMLHLFASDKMYSNSLAVLAAQLKEKVDGNHFTEKTTGNTPFHLLAKRDNSVECLQKMLQLIKPRRRGAILAQKDQNGDTALHIAAKLGEQTHEVFLDHTIPSIEFDDIIEILLNMQGEQGSVIDTAFAKKHFQFAIRCRNYLGCAIKSHSNRRSKQCNKLSNNKHFIELVTKKAAYGDKKILKSFLDLNEPAEQLVLLLLLVHLAKEKHQNIEPHPIKIKELAREIGEIVPEIGKRINEKLKAFVGEEHYNVSFRNWWTLLSDLYTKELAKDEERGSLARLFDVLLHFLDNDNLKQHALGWKNSRGYTILHVAAEIGHIGAIDKLGGFGQWEFIVERDRNALKNLEKAVLESDYHMADVVVKTTTKALERFGLTRLDKYLQPLESVAWCLTLYSTDKRQRWKEEVESVKEFCGKFGIVPIRREITTAAKMVEDITAVKRFQPSCLMVVLLCHGGGGRIETDDEVFPLRDIADAMAADFCFTPKVLIVQCCMTTAEAEKVPEDTSSEVELHHDIANHIQSSMTKIDKVQIDKINTKYKRPANLNIPARQKAKRAGTHNSKYLDMQNSMSKAVYAVGEIAEEANRAHHVVTEVEKPVEVLKSLKEKAEDAISSIGHAYQLSDANNVELCTHHCYRLHTKNSNTVSETARCSDGYIRCGHVFEELPRHFLCLMATTTGEAERLLMASKLKERADAEVHVENGNLVDLEGLFRDVRQRTATDSTFVQTPITASTLTKRLCLKLKGDSMQQAND